MAEIKDVYQLEFDTAGFTSQLQEAIMEVETLQDALDETTAGSEDLEKATSKLSNVLKTNATSTQDLNAKRLVLTKTQDGLRQNTVAYDAVASANVTTTRRLATETAKTATVQRGFFSQLVTGARGLNSVRRSAMLLGSVFRVLTGLNVFGLALQVLPAVISLFSGVKKEVQDTSEQTKRLDEATNNIAKAYGKETAELNNLFGALNEANKAGSDKSAIISEIQSKYGQYIGNINLETASQEELAGAYDLVARAIARQVITKQKAVVQEEIVGKILQESVKLYTEAGRAIENRAAAIDEINRQIDLAAKAQDITRIQQLNDELARLQTTLPNSSKAAGEASKNISNAQKELIETLSALDASAGIIEDTLVSAIDPSTLTGKLKAGGSSAAAAAKEYKILEGSLADLESQLSNLQKVLRDQTAISDPAALAAIQAQIDAQQTRVDSARALIADLQGVAKAEENIEKLRTSLILDEAERRIAQLQATARTEIQALVGNANQKAEQTRLIEEQLARDIQEVRQKSIDDAIKASDAERDRILAARETTARTELDAIVNTEERKLAASLQGIETRRNAALRAAIANISDAQEREAAVTQINLKANAERVELERATQRAILEARISATQATITGLEAIGDTAIAQKKDLEELRLALLELDRPILSDESKEKTKQSLREFITAIASEIQGLTDTIFDAIGGIFERYVAQLDGAIERTKSALSEIRENSEQFNARQLEIEKDRLEKLEAERQRAAEREQAIGLIQLTTNSLIAISKAAAEGGIAAPFTIASTIIALLAGFASARAAAGSAFFEGSEYVDRENRYPQGRDQVPARLNKGERVITTDTNAKYWDSLSAIHHRTIPAEAINNFVRNYPILPSAAKEGAGGIVYLQVGGNNSGVEKRLERIEAALLGLPQTQVTVGANAAGIFKITKNRLNRAERIRKISDR